VHPGRAVWPLFAALLTGAAAFGVANVLNRRRATGLTA
jgi:hypothetical protein